MKTPKPDPAVPAAAYTVKALVKALRILECLAEDDQPSYTLTELSRRLHLHVSTVHRLMVNLVRQGFVELDPASGGYQLGFQVLRMGLRVLDRLDYRRVAHPLLRELNQKTQETVHLAILQGDQAISIEKFGSPQPVALDARLGGQMPLHWRREGVVGLPERRNADEARQVARLGAPHAAHRHHATPAKERVGADSRTGLCGG